MVVIPTHLATPFVMAIAMSAATDAEDQNQDRGSLLPPLAIPAANHVPQTEANDDTAPTHNNST
jgi:hypothetical protein